MKRYLIVVVGLALVLSACSTGALRDVYTASGDGSKADDLNKTALFTHDDDLNVVITLNSHSRTLPIQAVFSAPDGSSYATDSIEADSTVGKLVLGLDWEAQNTGGWAPGEWSVNIMINNETEETLKFEVAPPPLTPVE